MYILIESKQSTGKTLLAENLAKYVSLKKPVYFDACLGVDSGAVEDQLGDADVIIYDEITDADDLRKFKLAINVLATRRTVYGIAQFITL